MSTLEALARARELLQAERETLFISESLADGSIPDPEAAALIGDYDEVIEALAKRLPDASERTDDNDYLSSLIDRSGLSTRAVAKRIGIDAGELRGYLSGRRPWPYPVQFAIEALAFNR